MLFFSVLSLLSYFFYSFLPFFFLFSLLFFYHALFHTVGFFLGLPARSPFRGVMWSHVSAARECEGRGKKGSLHPSSCSASSRVERESRLAARFTRYKARFPYDRCWGKKKISDHSNHMETGLKLESLLAGYSRDVLRRPSFSYLAIIK